MQTCKRWDMGATSTRASSNQHGGGREGRVATWHNGALGRGKRDNPNEGVPFAFEASATQAGQALGGRSAGGLADRDVDASGVNDALLFDARVL